MTHSRGVIIYHTHTHTIHLFLRCARARVCVVQCHNCNARLCCCRCVHCCWPGFTVPISLVGWRFFSFFLSLSLSLSLSAKCVFVCLSTGRVCVFGEKKKKKKCENDFVCRRRCVWVWNYFFFFLKFISRFGGVGVGVCVCVASMWLIDWTQASERVSEWAVRVCCWFALSLSLYLGTI